MGYQLAIIQGNVGKDPELRQVRQTQVASFSVAVSENWTDKNTGEKKEVTNWYKVSAWGKQADLVMNYVKKGDKVLCDGQVSANAYLGNDGQPMASLDLRLKTIQFLGGKQSPHNYPPSAPDVGDGDNMPF